MKIKKGDNIQIISGKDRGKRGKVLRTFPKDRKIIGEGLNIIKKHVRPKRSGEKGQRVEFPAPFAVSKAILICSNCGKLTRIGYRLEKNNKVRICKKCKGEIK